MNTDKTYAEAIAAEYTPKTASKIVALKKLDAKAKRPSELFTFSFGIIAALILGTGMCLAMKIIGTGTTASMVIGIIIGLFGILMMCVNYPIYKKLRESGKKKYAFEITELAKTIIEK